MNALPFRRPRTGPPPSQVSPATGAGAPAGSGRSLLSMVAGEPLGCFQEALRTAEEAASRLGSEALVDAIGEAERLKAGLWARLYTGRAPRLQEERLLGVEEAAARLGVSSVALYKKADAFPFTVRQGRSLRFSDSGISAWIRKRTR